MALLKRDGVEAYEGSVRYVHAVREAGLHTAVVSASANCKDVLQAAGIEDLFEVRIDGSSSSRGTSTGKPAPDTFLAAAKEVGVEPAEAAVFEDALAGVEADEPGASASSSESTAPVSARLCSSTAPTLSSPTCRAAGAKVIIHPAFAVEPWNVRETQLDLNVLAQTESVFALLERSHRPARQPRRGRALRDPGDLPELVSTRCGLSQRRGRLRLPESGQTVLNVTNGKIIRLLVDDEPFDVRYGRLLVHERELDLATAFCDGTSSGVAGGKDRPGRFDAACLIYSPLRGGDSLRGAAGRFGSASGHPVGS